LQAGFWHLESPVCRECVRTPCINLFTPKLFEVVQLIFFYCLILQILLFKKMSNL
jgi:hypothetical protein